MTINACSSKKTPPVVPPVAVSTAIAEKRDIPFYIDTLGHFVPYNSVIIQAQVQGELNALYFNEGQEVQQGDLLFTIDAKPYQATLDKAIATLKQNEALFAYNKSRADRYSQLVEDDFVSKLEYDQYFSEMKNYEAILNENQADIESAAINVGYCTLRAPITGVTGKRLVDVGNIITDVGSQLLKINQVTPLFIDFSIPERYFDTVFQNQQKNPLKVELYVPNTPLKDVATLQMIDNSVNPQTGMIALRGIIENKEKKYWPEQFVRVRLIVNTISNAIMVPPEAVLPSSLGEIVWVVDNNHEVKSVIVESGESYDGKIRILKGIEPGMQVVTKGQLTLLNGKKVVIKNESL